MLPQMFPMAELCVCVFVTTSLSIYLKRCTLRLFPYLLLEMKLPSNKLKHVKMWNRV